jgi:hypothetical protein
MKASWTCLKRVQIHNNYLFLKHVLKSRRENVSLGVANAATYFYDLLCEGQGHITASVKGYSCLGSGWAAQSACVDSMTEHYVRTQSPLLMLGNCIQGTATSQHRPEVESRQERSRDSSVMQGWLKKYLVLTPWPEFYTALKLWRISHVKPLFLSQGIIIYKITK